MPKFKVQCRQGDNKDGERSYRAKGFKQSQKGSKGTKGVKNLVLHSDMIRYLKHCDSGRNDKLDFLETTFKASRQTLDVVQDHVATFVTSLVRDLQVVDFNKGSGKKKVKKIVTEKDLEQLIHEKGLSALYYDFDDMERPSNTRQNALFIDPREMNHTIRKIPGVWSSRSTRRANAFRRRRQATINPLLLV